MCVPGDATVLRRPLPERVDGLAVVHRLLLPRRRAAALPPAVRRHRGDDRPVLRPRGHAARERPGGAHAEGQRVVLKVVLLLA